MNKRIAIIGLGYVGLPLAVEFAKKYLTIGYDINNNRVNELNKGIDKTLEVDENNLKKVLTKHRTTKNSKGLICTSNLNDIKKCNIYIITVPTPTDLNKRPDLKYIIDATQTIGKIIKKNDIIIYESTVYPGVTDDECIPVLEKYSGLTINEDFHVGYSPERINPGDKKRGLINITKVTSGSNQKAALIIDNLYKSIINAGTHLAPSIKVAEASKVIENSQRDINIAFVNELAKIFSKINIDTHDVLEAASTKWNFLPFKPGLVGGYCIGVDPYYLAQKAEQSGYYPEIILAGRRINDSMGNFVASQIVKKMVFKDVPIKGSDALILGFSFKENCPDFRNTKVVDIYNDLISYGLIVDIYDPWVDKKEVFKQYKVSLLSKINQRKKYDAIILAVSHDEFLSLNIKKITKKSSVIFDIKGFLPKNEVTARL